LSEPVEADEALAVISEPPAIALQVAVAAASLTAFGGGEPPATELQVATAAVSLTAFGLGEGEPCAMGETARRGDAIRTGDTVRRA